MKTNAAISATLYKGQTVLTPVNGCMVLGNIAIVGRYGSVRVRLDNGKFVHPYAKELELQSVLPKPKAKATVNDIAKRKIENVIRKHVGEIYDKKLMDKLFSIPHVINIKGANTSTRTQSAGFFPWGNGIPLKVFINGTKFSPSEFFEAMKEVGGGLKGKASRIHHHQKGMARSRIESGATVGSGEVTIDGFEVPSGWVQHYTKEHKIPLNLYTNNIKGSFGSVSVTYIAKKPIY